jgi:hypothetical protein
MGHPATNGAPGCDKWETRMAGVPGSAKDDKRVGKVLAGVG